MAITKELFGKTSEGAPVNRFVMESRGGMRVLLIELGGCLQEIHVPDKTGALRDVCLGYDTVAAYEDNPTFFGALLGRLISRSPDCCLHFEGRDYPLANLDGMHMHGGPRGFSKVRWWGEIAGDDAVTFRYVSLDGEEGYPGTVDAAVTYRLSPANALSITYDFGADRRTVVNPSNHCYFNLNGHASGSVAGHRLRCPGTSLFNQLTGEEPPLPPVFDLRRGKTLGDIFTSGDPAVEALGGGIDRKYALAGDGEMKFAAEASSPDSGITLECLTEMPGIMIYTGNALDGGLAGKGGARYGKYAGFCLETMLRHSLEERCGCSPIVYPGRRFRSTTVFRFGVEG